MFKIKMMPSETEVLLPAGVQLTELEHELREDNIPFGCKSGACGACVIEVLDGLANLNSKEEDEDEFLEMLGFSGPGFRLACQCQLNGAVTLRVAK
ncbi:2Fe-2S ferredoxin-type domain-containing protein [Acetobacteraceae bacterium EV16G]|uniref:2Fe-2S ferredoxin-type domain-containing protein n=1 Tax=Sorlinia euscelidii TaxID=3081148 RepID=A0ABU7TYQ8_9PROT